MVFLLNLAAFLRRMFFFFLSFRVTVSCFGRETVGCLLLAVLEAHQRIVLGRQGGVTVDGQVVIDTICYN